MSLLLAVQALSVLHAAGSVVMSGSDSGSGGGGELALLLAGPIGGSALYAAIHRYYRNADRTHDFEDETLITLKDAITGEDEKVDEVRGTRKDRIEDDNVHDHRRRVAPLD